MKTVRENEIIHSDRIQLVQQANCFIEEMVNKTTLPKIGSGYAPEIELSEHEEATYRSALKFLERQFTQGYSTLEPVEKRVESEKTVEQEVPPKN